MSTGWLAGAARTFIHLIKFIWARSKLCKKSEWPVVFMLLLSDASYLKKLLAHLSARRAPPADPAWSPLSILQLISLCMSSNSSGEICPRNNKIIKIRFCCRMCSRATVFGGLKVAHSSVGALSPSRSGFTASKSHALKCDLCFTSKHQLSGWEHYFVHASFDSSY